MAGALRNRFVNFSHTVIKTLRKISIFQRLMVSFLVLVILPTIFITLFTYNMYVNEIEKNMEKFISLLVQNVNIQITDKLSSLERLSVQFYSDSTIVAMLEENAAIMDAQGDKNGAAYKHNRRIIGQKLNTVAKGSGYGVSMQIITPYDQYFMIDEFGNRSGGYVRDLDHFRQSEYYTGALDQHGYPVWFDTSRITNVFYRSENLKYGMADLITMTQAIYNPENDKFLGVIVMNMNISHLTDSLKSYSFYGSGNTFLFGQNGAIAWINSDISAPNLANSKHINPLIYRVHEGFYDGKIDGANVFMVYKLVPYTDLSVVHIVNKDRLLENAYRIRKLCLTIVAILIMLSVVVAYWTTVSISRPINKLMKAMQTFTKEAFVVNYTVSGNDEITVLGKKFNEMVDNTNTLIDKIYIAEIREKTLELNKANAELNALQMQIDPHFLYNTLDIIRWEAMYEAGGESKASRMIDDFCRLMRMTIKKSEDKIPIQSELAHVETYIEVMNFRHRDKIMLSLDFAFDPQVYYIPKLTIQPLIENAVVHAFDDVVANAEIAIKGYIENSDLVISVTDNGRGIQPDQLAKLTRTLSGTGSTNESIALNNVNQRLKLSFGQSCGLTVMSEPGAGTTVLIRLPMREATLKQADQLVAEQEG